MNSDAERTFVKDLAGDDDDDPVQLLSSVSLREQGSFSPVEDASPTAKSPPKRLRSLSDSDHQEDERDIRVSSSVDNKEVEPFGIEEPSERPQRTTILKRCNHPIRVSTTYISNVNSNQPTSPTGSHNSAQSQKGCCTIL